MDSALVKDEKVEDERLSTYEEIDFLGNVLPINEFSIEENNDEDSLPEILEDKENDFQKGLCTPLKSKNNSVRSPL